MIKNKYNYFILTPLPLIPYLMRNTNSMQNPLTPCLMRPAVYSLLQSDQLASDALYMSDAI